MPESLHERYDRDEQRLVATASTELWSDAMLDAVVDAAAHLLGAASWREVPEEAPPRWAQRSTAGLALAAMALRATRTVALTVRAGYAAEAVGGLRRLFEAAGHAQRVAEDASGEYAENWLRGHGKAGKPRVAFGPNAEDGPIWSLMSGQAHAEFAGYVNLCATLDDERRLVHSIGPSRDPFSDSIWLWLAARQLTRVLAGLLKVHPQLDDGDFLTAAGPIHAAEEQIEAEIAKREA